MSVDELFAAAGLTPAGPISWTEKCPERRPGVYAVTVEGAGVVYVGRAGTSLARRLGQFYRHRYGARSPHRGGEGVLVMQGARSVYWSATEAPREAERLMLAAFERRTGRLPAANRRRGDGAHSFAQKIALLPA